MTSRRRRLTVAALATTLALGITVPAAVAGDDDLRSRKHRVDAALEDSHEELASADRRIDRATQAVLDARAKLPAARQELRAAHDLERDRRAAHEQATAKLRAAQAEVVATQAKLTALQARIDTLQIAVGDFARRAYQMGPMAELEVVLDAKDPSELTDRLAAIREVGAAKSAALDQMAANRAELAYLEATLSALRDQAEIKQGEAEELLEQAEAAAAAAADAQAQVRALVAQEAKALRVAEAGRATIRAQYDRLAAEQARLAEQIRRAAAQAGVGNGGGGSGNGGGGGGGGGNGGGSGDFYFPLPGYSIGSDAGWRFHPILHYVRCHAGSDIGAPSGTPIHAADDGVVIQAGWNGGYGNFTVIAHTSTLTTGYGHQTRIIVSSGQRVSRGQVIGYVGSTGLSTAPHLHFEVRISGQPYAPKGWFGQDSKHSVCT